MLRIIAVFSLIAVCFSFGIIFNSGFSIQTLTKERQPTSEAESASRLQNCGSLERPHSDRILLIAHRGDEQKYVENTYEAIVSGAQSGADFVEIDVRKTKDGVFMIHHDEYTGRVTGCTDGDVAIKDSTWEHLRTKCSYKYVAPVSALMNSLSEVLEFTKNEKAGLVLDVKPDIKASDMQAFADELLKLDPHGKCMVGAANQGTFGCFRNIIIYVNDFEAQDRLVAMTKGLVNVDKKYRILANMTFLKITGNAADALKDPDKFLNHEGLAFHFNSASCETLHALRVLPEKMLVGWTLETKQELHDAQRMGLDAVVTSRLHDYLKYLGRDSASQ